MAKMAKNRKEEYKEQNLRYLEEIASQEGVKTVSYTHLTLPTNSRV